jgi:hypothetical protein
LPLIKESILLQSKSYPEYRYMKLSISLSLGDDGDAGDAASGIVVESRSTDVTHSILPRDAVFHLTGSVHQVVVAVAAAAVQAGQVEAALHLAAAALELEVWQAIRALSALVPHASQLYILADSVASEVVPAVAGGASVLVVGLAVGDFAVAVGEQEGAVALLAHVADLVAAPQH